ncbi:MAG: hypothetical protein AAF804_19145, partial [Bacteroidota bacterium]
AGTLVIGVTPGLLISPPAADRYQSAQQWVDHYYRQTWAQKLGFWLSKPLQRNLVMLTATELDFKNDLDLKSLIDNYPLKGRLPYNPGLPKFGYNDEDRNLYMFPTMVIDTSFRQGVRDMWMSFLPSLPGFEVVEAMANPRIVAVGKLIKQFEERGGKVILIRHESEGPWYENFERFYPKEKVWDRIVEECGCTHYHFNDYAFMAKYELPDWSHMNATDAESYTRDMVNQLIQDGHLTPLP